jgi:general secretion pathway protein D
MHNTPFKLSPIAIFSIAACALLAGASALFPSYLHAQPAVQGPPLEATTSPSKVKRGQPITLNFTNAEIEAVARTMAALTGRSVVVDPRVKGTITLITDAPVSPAVAYHQFRSVLRLQGFTVVQSDGLDKILPEADAKLQVNNVPTGEAAVGNQIATQIIPLRFDYANNLLPILRPLISPNNTINANPNNNSLVITDYGDNLRRIQKIVSAMDVSNATDVEVIPLKHAIAGDLAPLVLRLLEPGGGAPGAAPGGGDGSFKTAVIAEPRSNALILRAANPSRLALARSLIAKLDQPGSENASGNMFVVYLKNADATKLAVTLRAAMASAGTATTAAAPAPSGPAGAPGAAAPAAASTGGQIQADAATNSLIITAPEPQYRQLREVIDKLDARRAQVFVESLIAEVNADKAAEFGIQWQGAAGQAGDSNVGILGTNFSIGGANLISLATGAAAGTVAPSTGLNVGIAHQTNGVYVLGFLARYLQANGDGNILSTPNLLTLDNEEAKIVIGQNVPFVTGQFTNTGTTGGSVNPFQTIERKDVGLTLRIKPQISENGTVKLTIFQEVSSVQASSVNSASGLITNKRSIESTVLVGDGSIVVLGGLLSDEYAGNQEKVPGLADIPLFGNLFKGETRSRKKTNLMVFLRPVILRDAASSDSFSMDRYEQMRSGQQQAQPEPSSVVPVNGAPVLPAAPAVKKVATKAP